MPRFIWMVAGAVRIENQPWYGKRSTGSGSAPPTFTQLQKNKARVFPETLAF
jgi:hypothetical protein